MRRVNQFKRIATLTNPYYREREKPMGQDLSIPKVLGSGNSAPSHEPTPHRDEEEDEEYTLQLYQQRKKAISARHSRHYRSDSGYDSSTGKFS